MDWLQRELEEVSEKDIQPPDNELEDGDVVVGTLEDPEIKKIYLLYSQAVAVLKQLEKEIAHAKIDLVEEESSEEHDSANCNLCGLELELSRRKKVVKFLTLLWWTCLWSELSEDVQRRVDAVEKWGIRKDWQIVLIKQDNPEGNFLEVILRNLAIPN